MINNRLYSSIIRPKTILQGTAKAAQGTDMVTRFMKNKLVGKICETAADNPVICQSAFSLAICCGARPITNYITTPDKKDAAYASCHSISSGVMGFVWPLIIATPLAAGVGLVLKKPQKFLKPEIIKKFYPSVGLETVVKNGKKITKVMTNTKGEMLRQDGSVLCRNLEPLKMRGDAEAASKIKEISEKIAKAKTEARKQALMAQKTEMEARKAAFETEKAAFEAANPKLSVDKNGVVRSREVFKTENGKYVLDANGNKIGCAVQKPEKAEDLRDVLDGKKELEVRPITEEMEIGINKEQNIKSMINWVPDILLAPPRAMLTIELIPRLLKLFGMEKKKKGPAPAASAPQGNNTPAPAAATMKNNLFTNIKTHNVAAPKKGGV